LEVAYAACHDAGRPRKDLAKKTIGVFVGQCANDWAKTLSERKAGTFMGPGSHVSWRKIQALSGNTLENADFVVVGVPNITE